jgi:hypothetical protein
LSGAKPPLIPYLSPVAFTIAVLAIDPMLVDPSVSAASTLTAGDVRSDVGFVNVNVIAQAVFAATVVATERISVPVSLFQSPDDPSELLSHVVTARLDEEAVAEPASPVIVTVDPIVKSQFTFRVTVIILLAVDTGVLCSIDLVLNVGTTTVSGSSPLATPYNVPPGLLIASCVTLPTVVPPSVSVAATFTVGEVRVLLGFSSENVIVYACPLVSVFPSATVSLSVPSLFQSPADPKALSGAEVTARSELVAVSEPASPVIVTIVPAGAVCVSDSSVTVSVLV